MWPCTSAAPEPADLRLLEGDLAPLLLARDSSLDGEGDSLDATGDAAHRHTRTLFIDLYKSESCFLSPLYSC